MALDLGGRRADADRAYQWLVDRHLHDGSWHHYYLADGIEDPKFDANVIAYVAAGAWHHFLLTRNRGFLETMWPVVERAIDWVLELQTRRGEILWARHPAVENSLWTAQGARSEGLFLAAGASFRPLHEVSPWMRFNVTCSADAAVYRALGRAPELARRAAADAARRVPGSERAAA